MGCDYLGIAALFFMIMVGMAFVSVHYRKKYEELRSRMGIINMKEEVE